MKNPKKLERWPEKKVVHHKELRQKMALSFGNFEAERKVRADLVDAIRTCDESKIARIAVKGYDQGQTQAILRRYGIYQYTAQEIATRLASIDAQLLSMLPSEEVSAVREALFGALKVEKAGADLLKLSPEQKSKLRDSGLADYLDIRI